MAAEYILVCKFLWSYGNILYPMVTANYDNFILKSFPNPLNKLSTEQIYFERFLTLLSI